MYGNEDNVSSRTSRHTHSYTRGFEAEASADELFNMFFGGGFANSNIYVRRGGRWQRQNASTHENHSHREVKTIIFIITSLYCDVNICFSATTKQLHELFTNSTNSGGTFVVDGFEYVYFRSCLQFTGQLVSVLV